MNKEIKTTRPLWADYFLDMADLVATRSTCPRRHVGCVIVKDRTVVSTGYNGSLPGALHCDDAGCLMENGHCVRTIHAEQNAILQAAKRGVALDGCWAYVNWEPCPRCAMYLKAAGIEEIVWRAPKIK